MLSVICKTPRARFGNLPSRAARKIGSHRLRQALEPPDLFLSDVAFTAASLHDQFASVTPTTVISTNFTGLTLCPVSDGMPPSGIRATWEKMDCLP